MLIVHDKMTAMPPTQKPITISKHASKKISFTRFRAFYQHDDYYMRVRRHFSGYQESKEGRCSSQG